MRSRLLRSLLLAATAWLALPAFALDLSWSGFGTIGWARSDRAWAYDRSVDDGGTLDRDSVFGLQVDARLSAQWSATLQLKAAQAHDQNNAWEAVPAWAFVAWRPSDDWMLRVGRMRVPLFLYSEQIEAGATHDFARLPAEMYSMAPINDFDGVYATKTWNLGDDELQLDFYAGGRDTEQRFWWRDGGPGVAPGESYIPMRLRGEGFALALHQPEGVWRASLYRVRLTPGNGGGIVRKPIYREVGAPGSGIGYYQVVGPEVERLSTMTVYVFTAGMERRLGADWRVAAEFARMLPRKTEVGANVSAGYVAVFRDFGPVTPYLSLARLRGSDRSLDWYRRLTETRMPDAIYGAADAYAAQRIVAETMLIGDQQTLALGATWNVATGQKLKIEWQRTTIGRMSKLVDTPPAASPTIHDTHVDVWSLNYNFIF